MIDDVRRGELTCREVHGHRQCAPRDTALPSAAVRHASSSTQRPIGDDGAVALGDGDEPSGSITPRVGWSQRSKASKPTILVRLQFDDRLVDESNWCFVDDLVQVALEFEAVEGRVASPARRRSTSTCPSSSPCTSRRRHRASSTRRCTRRRRARCRCWPTARSVGRRRLNGFRLGAPARRPSRPRRARGRSPRSGSRTRRRRGATRCRRSDDARAVESATSRSTWSPASWPRLSLTILKPSRSRYTTATPRPVRAVRSSGVLEAIVEQRTVGQPGDRIVKCAVAELLLGPLAIGDVTQVDHHAADGRIVREIGGADAEPPVRPIGVGCSHLGVVDHDRSSATSGPTRSARPSRSLGPEQARPRPCRWSRHRVAEHRRRGSGHRSRSPVAVDHDHGVGGVLGERGGEPRALFEFGLLTVSRLQQARRAGEGEQYQGSTVATNSGTGLGSCRCGTAGSRSFPAPEVARGDEDRPLVT